MSKTEDYLDGLLNSMEGKTNTTAMPEEQPVELGEEPLPQKENKGEEQEFLDSFERELLSGEDADEFIRQFERELDEEPGDDEFVNTFLDSTDVSTDDSREALDENEPLDENKPVDEDVMTDDADLDFMVDTLGDSFGDIPNVEDDDEPLPGLGDEPSEGEDQNLMDLLQAEGDFSDIGDMFHTEDVESDLEAEPEPEAIAEDTDGFSDDFDGFTLEEVPIDDTMVLEDAAIDGSDTTEGEHKKEASGFLKKLSQVLFGEEDEDEDEVAGEEPVQAKIPAEKPDIEDLSDENMMLLQELEGTGAADAEDAQEVPETKEEAKARKKREKEEAKAKKKAEKAEKKAQAKAAREEKKAKKEKKPKKPKEPDNTPPLPKKPVILSFVMVGSFLILVLLGTHLFGYSSCMQEAEKQYALGNYTEAYEMVSGLNIKEKDDALYQKYRVLGTVEGEYSAYQTFMESGIYDMALDSLVRAVGRCQKYQPDAQEYGCADELMKVRDMAVGALGGFGITEERALELYGLEEREEYSTQIQAILAQAGYTIN